jgi:RNA polymerase sigma-70 factor (ECF subfamily)
VGSQPSDGELVASLRQQRAGAFDEVYARYREPVWRFLVRLCGRRDLAEDLFQETWLAAARYAHRLREDSQLLPWLYTIARNKHRNALRFRLLDRKRHDEALAEPMPSPAEAEVDADARRRAAQVARALSSLPEAYREVLLLFFDEGLATDDVAHVLGLRADAVRKRLSRARAQLARILELPDQGGTNDDRA